MKNFKLLLASTAILSTGLALNVLGGTTVATGVLHGRISMVRPISITDWYELDFGIVSDLENNQTVIIGLDSDTATGTATRIGDYTRRGIINISGLAGYQYDTLNGRVNAELVVPSSMPLKNSNLQCGTVALTVEDNGNLTPDASGNDSVYIGGTFTATIGGEGQIDDNDGKRCIGSVDVTVVINYDLDN